VTNPVPIDYEAVLADMRDKRNSLDRAIAAMEYWMLELPQAQPKGAAGQVFNVPLSSESPEQNWTLTRDMGGWRKT
jgi:hypothetical protein